MQDPSGVECVIREGHLPGWGPLGVPPDSRGSLGAAGLGRGQT